MKKLMGLLFLMGMVRGAQAAHVLFLVDISGSMSALIPNIAKSISEQAEPIASRGEGMGLISFHGCGKNTVNYVVPFAKDNAQAIKDGTKKLVVTGSTDIVAPLMMAKEINTQMIKNSGECANVILFTDDEDNCNSGNPHFAILKDLQKMCTEKAKDFKIDVVTSTVDENTRLFLDEIVNFSGGKVHPAATVDEINEKVKNIVEGYGGKAKGTPLAAKTTKPDTKGGDTQPAPLKPLPAAEKLPARQGKEDKKEKKEDK